MKTSLKKMLDHFPWFKSANGVRDLAWLDRIKIPDYQKWLIGIATTILLTVLVSPGLQLPLKEYKVGDVATKEVRSSQDLLIEDEKSTQEKRAEAVRSVFSLYDYDPGVLTDAQNRVRSTFQVLASLSRKREKGNDLHVKRKKEWDSFLRSPLTPKEWQVLERENFTPKIGEAALGLLVPILAKGVVDDKDLLDPDAYRGLVIRNIQTREERRNLPPYGFFDFKEARSKLRSQTDLLAPNLGRDLPPVVLKIAENLMRPNLTFNKDETEERKAKARENIYPVFFQIKRGEVILRAGERVLAEHPFKMNALGKALERRHLLAVLLGLGVLTFLILASFYQFSTQNIRKFMLSQKDLLLSSITLV